MEIKGQVEEFIYQNEANGYCIGVFSLEDGEALTIVGYLPFISVRRYIKIKWQDGNTSGIWRTI